MSLIIIVNDYANHAIQKKILSPPCSAFSAYQVQYLVMQALEASAEASDGRLSEGRDFAAQWP